MSTWPVSWLTCTRGPGWLRPPSVICSAPAGVPPLVYSGPALAAPPSLALVSGRGFTALRHVDGVSGTVTVWPHRNVDALRFKAGAAEMPQERAIGIGSPETENAGRQEGGPEALEALLGV